MTDAPHRLPDESDEDYAARLNDYLFAEDARFEHDVAEESHRAEVRDAAKRRRESRSRPPVGTLGRTAAEVLATSSPTVDWNVPGLEPRGSVSAWASIPKIGKGTLATYLIGCLERGEDSVFGPSAQMTTLYVTEEPEDSIREKLDDFDVQAMTIVYGYELAGMLIDARTDALIDEAHHRDHERMVIDNLARFFNLSGSDENDPTAGAMVGRFGERTTATGLTVQFHHHFRKTAGSVSEMFRGGTALPAVCDVLVGMEPVDPVNTLDRRRKLTAVGRIKATRWVGAVELSPDGHTYGWTDVPAAQTAAARTAESRTQRLQVDTEWLKERGRATVKEYEEEHNVTEKTARLRLGKLEANGRARADHSRSPIVWEYRVDDDVNTVGQS